jgi:hypothetical protein
MKSVQIGLRLPEEISKDLAKIAQRDQTTIGKAARRLLIDAVTKADEALVRQELAELRDEVSVEFSRLRKQLTVMKEAFALCFTAIMVDGLNHSAGEVEEWLKENILERSSHGHE